ncbi:hypothetical protein ACWOB3_07620 [Enterococcus songbeiensis]
MNTIRFALASLQYHRRSITPYWLTALFFFFALSFFVCLKMSFDVFCQQITTLFSPEERSLINTELFSADLKSYTEKIDTFYRLGFFLVGGLFILVTLLFLYFYLKKRPDLTVFRKSGVANHRWLGQLLAEFLLPAFLLFLVVMVTLLIFQPLLQTTIENSHRALIQHYGMDQLQIELINGDDLTRWLVKLPANGTSLFNSIQLPARTWTLLFVQSALKTLAFFTACYFVLIPLIISFFLRRKAHDDRHTSSN